MTEDKNTRFRIELGNLIDFYTKRGVPDCVLAEYLAGCLELWDGFPKANIQIGKWRTGNE